MKSNDDARAIGGPSLRATTATLLGMATVVGSLFLPWERVTPPGAEILAAGALYRTRGPLTVLHNGFAAGVWQPLTLCAVVACATLLWKSTPDTRRALAAVQGAGALACLVVPLAHIALLSGVVVALTGGALLMFGVLERVQDRSVGVSHHESEG